MRRLWSGVFGLLVVMAALPTAAHAQGRSCRSVLPSDFRRIVNARGEEVVYFRDPVRFLCTGDVLLEADSAVMNRSASAVELVGNVVYRDSTRELRSDWANYLGGLDQLLTRGSTVVRDLEGGAVVRGEQLNYLRESLTRPEARMIITGGRPYAVIPPRARGSGGARRPGEAGEASPPGGRPERGDDRPPGALRDTASIPTEVWADRMELEGGDVFRADGNVDLKRGQMVGAGRNAVFDQAAETMALTGTAFVQNESYRLEGDTINAFLEGEGLREVRSRGSARVTSEDLHVRGQHVRIGFSGDEIQRLEAWNTEPGAGRRARAEASNFRMRGDSIDAQADSLGIRELRAVGRAYGERDLPDGRGDPDASGDFSATTTAPPARLPEAIARDWIQGDTILGFFSRETTITGEGREEAAGIGRGDPLSTEPAGESDVALERIVVVGGDDPALSLYRMVQDGSRRPAINFMKARRIILFMEQGELARVEAEGPIEGLYMDPSGGEGEVGEGGARPEAVEREGEER